jgi:small basic protein
MTIEFLWSTIGTILLVGTSLWAMWRGQRPERWGGAILLVGLCLTMLVQPKIPGYGPNLAYVLVDIAALVGFVIVSLWSRRIWTIFISAFQLNAVASHFLGRLETHVDIYTLITALGMWGGYGLTFALMAGMWTVERQRSRAKA